MIFPILWFFHLVCASSRVFAQVAPHPGGDAESSAISYGVIGTGLAVVISTVGKIVTDTIQFRIQQSAKNDNAKLVLEVALMTAERDDEKEGREQEKKRADLAETRIETLLKRHESLRDSYDELRIKYAMATNQEPPSSSRLGWAVDPQHPPGPSPEKPP
jgi:hypothetical protein